MTISYRKDKKSGITYAYECTSVWVPELKQARNHRKYLGRVDEQGNIIPSSGKRGRPPKEAPSAPAPAEIQQETDFVNEIQTRDQEIARLKAENEQLRTVLSQISGLLEKCGLKPEEDGKQA